MKKIIVFLILAVAIGSSNAQSLPAKSAINKKIDTVFQKRVRKGTVSESGNSSVNRTVVRGKKEQNVSKKSEASLNPQPLPPVNPDKQKGKKKSKKVKIKKIN